MKFSNRFRLITQLIRREGGIKGAAKMIKAAPKYLALYRGLLTDPRVPQHAKVALLGAAGFVVSPFNIVAYIPLLGAIDDIAILALAHGYFMKQIPTSIMSEHRVAVNLSDDLP